MTAPLEIIKVLENTSTLEDIAAEYLYLDAPLKETKSAFLYEQAKGTKALCEMLEVALEALEKYQGVYTRTQNPLDMFEERQVADDALDKINSIAGEVK